MSKELIRNGGFERGNMDFWETLSGSVEIQTDEKKRGSYAAKITKTVTGGAIIVKDYIPVTPFALYKLTAWLKTANDAPYGIQTFYKLYDSDYTYIGNSYPYWEVGAFDWSKWEFYLSVPDEVSYIRPFFSHLLYVNDLFFYLDSLSLQQIEPSETLAQKVQMLLLTNLVADATAYSQEFFTGVWKQAEYHLYCTSLTGTTPTLNVTIQGYDPSTEQWKDVLVFQELDDAGSEFKTLLSGLGWKQRAKFTTAGTITDCDFTLGVIYKR